ncbi:MAG TPA: glycosyltransferase family 9 protein [Patescibacteria group bacterium]|nr:glycosyltransferase family 9 protein [Patescibacteria group bacterium]
MKESRDKRNLLPRMVSFLVRRIGARRSFALPADVEGSSRLLVIDSGELTDMLFIAPVMNRLHERFPGKKTTILVNSDDAPVVREIMKINMLLTYETKQLRIFKADYWALVRRLRRERIETVVLLSRRFALERHLLAFACGGSVRIGFAHPLAYPFINCEVRFSEDLYEGSKVSSMLETVGLRADREKESIALSPHKINHARQLIHFRKPEKETLTVGVDPGRGKTSHKVILEIVTYLANNLASRRKVKFLVLTNPWDGRVAARFAADLKAEVLDLVPANIGETVALLSQCDLFLAGNTDLFHFATALRVPTIGLFTKYDGQSWIPTTAPHVRIFKGTHGEKLSLQSFFAQVEEVLATRCGMPI